MPELPEVETIVRELCQSSAGKKFEEIEVRQQSSFVSPFKNYQQKIKGLKILDVIRRGKFIIFVLSGRMRLVVHLRMTGRLMWKEVRGKEKFIRVVFTFSDGDRLIFSDVRKFGRVWLYSEKDFEKATGVARLGLDPFADNFTAENFLQLFEKRKGILKNNLLRQDLIAGIGNIYADEICYRIGVHPSSRLEKFKKLLLKKMHKAVIYCLQEGINHCGVSVSDFVGTRGTLGKHQHYLQVYGRKGDRCYNCLGTINKTVVAGRGTFFCPNCQVKV